MKHPPIRARAKYQLLLLGSKMLLEVNEAVRHGETEP